MNDFFFARSQMAMSLAFHIIFAALGIGLPVLMAVAEGAFLRTRDVIYLDLAQRWARGAAILFAVGAVSGTVLSFELGLLWPAFMEKAGAIIGMPFSLEGFAFFTEAIFLGIYLYGWKKLKPFWHWVAGLLVAISGIFSGIFVVTANAWMNAPAGFKFSNGKFTDIDPIAAMLNPASLHEVVHMTLAALVATGFSVAAVHAYFLRRDVRNNFHRRALAISLALGCICIPLQMISGDMSARAVARLQPVKLAAMEAYYKTQNGAAFELGGIPDDNSQTVRGAIEIPNALSFLVAHDFHARIPGLEEFPRADWPNVRIVHWSFDVMVGCGTILFLLALIALWLWWKNKKLPDNKIFLLALVAAGPLGFIAIETGWMVTEVGRQPWIIYGVMRTSEAVTPMHGLIVPFIIFTILYFLLAAIVVFLLRRQFLETAVSKSISETSRHHV
jgi:cytochrome d ubiquinol oxidase subunit I